MNQKPNKYFDKKNLVRAAKITGIDGTKGGVTIEFAAQNYDIDITEPALVEIDGCLIPFFFDQTQTFENKKGVVVKFDTVNSVEDAKDLINKDLYVLKEHLIVYDNQNEDYNDNFEFIGYIAIDHATGNIIGKIIDFNPIPGNPIIEIENSQKQEILIPLAAIEIKNQDEENKKLTITIPDGILELN